MRPRKDNIYRYRYSSRRRSLPLFPGARPLNSLQATRDVVACYDKLVCLFERLHLFLERLKRYENTKLTTAMIELLGKVMAQVLIILALSTKETRTSRISVLIHLAHFPI
jgi:hypothetical protein